MALSEMLMELKMTKSCVMLWDLGFGSKDFLLKKKKYAYTEGVCVYL